MTEINSLCDYADEGTNFLYCYNMSYEGNYLSMSFTMPSLVLPSQILKRLENADFGKGSFGLN